MYEVEQEAKHIAQLLPQEGDELILKAVRFDEKHSSIGWAVIFSSGTTIGTGKKGILLVPERSLKIIDQLSNPIPYEIIPLDQLANQPPESSHPY